MNTRITTMIAAGVFSHMDTDSEPVKTYAISNINPEEWQSYGETPGHISPATYRPNKVSQNKRRKLARL